MKTYTSSLLMVACLFISCQLAASSTVPDYKYKTAAEVFKKLVTAKGDLSMAKPKFVMVALKEQAAWMNGNDAIIGLEETAYDACISFGKDSLNALAALLAHEVIHYYQRHHWSKSFASQFVNLETGKLVANQDTVERVKHETQADHLGGFLSHAAGYTTFEIMPVLLDKIYKNYGASDVLPGYPSLKERKKIALESSVQARKLVDVFETANYLTILKNYEAAALYYSFVLKSFQSRELHNNIGVIHFLAALDLFDDAEVPYAYPVELDAISRLSTITRAGDGDRLERRLKHLEEAQRNFENAKTLDRNYMTAWLNMGCVASLLKQYDEAALYALKAKRLAKTEVAKANVEVLEGILAVQQNDYELAKMLFEGAAEKSFFAKLNKINIGADSTKVVFTKSSTEFNGLEQIDGLNLDKYLLELDFDDKVDLRDNTICAQYRLPNSKILLNYKDSGKEITVFHLIDYDYGKKTSKNIGLNAAADEIIKAYGLPDQEILWNQGTCMLYVKAKIIFILDDIGKLKRWCVYRDKQ